MQTRKEEPPNQDLPERGVAVPSKRSTNESGTAPTVAAQDSMPAARRSKSEGPSHAELIKFATSAAYELVSDQTIDPMDYVPLLKTKLDGSKLRYSDSDIRRYIRSALNLYNGRKDIISAGHQIDRREEEWLWKGVIMRQATNMVFAHPKVGKTRLILAMLSDFVKGRGEFAGLGLYPGPEKILLLGPDQSERSWGNYLAKADLLTDDNCLPESIIGMVTAESGFAIDEYWLSRVELKLKEHGPLIVLLDSYSAATRALECDENSSAAALPMQQLHNLVMQYDSTLIIIHHSNKAGGDGDVSKMARGSSAITAAADNLIGMKKWQGDEVEGVKKYELLVTGRAETDGSPLIGYNKHSETWESFGSASSAREEQSKDENYDNLTVHQLKTLDALVRALKEENKGLTVNEVCELTFETVTKTSKVAVSKQLKRLEVLGFAEVGTPSNNGARYKQNYWKPTAWAVAKHQIDF